MIGVTDQHTVILHLKQCDALLLSRYLDQRVELVANVESEVRDLAQLVGDGLSLANWMREDVELSISWAEVNHFHRVLSIAGDDQSWTQTIRQALDETVGTTGRSVKAMETADELCVLTG